MDNYLKRRSLLVIQKYMEIKLPMKLKESLIKLILMVQGSLIIVSG